MQKKRNENSPVSQLHHNFRMKVAFSPNSVTRTVFLLVASCISFLDRISRKEKKNDSIVAFQIIRAVQQLELLFRLKCKLQCISRCHVCLCISVLRNLCLHCDGGRISYRLRPYWLVMVDNCLRSQSHRADSVNCNSVKLSSMSIVFNNTNTLMPFILLIL